MTDTGWLTAETLGSYWQHGLVSPLLDDVLESAQLSIERELRVNNLPVPAPADPDAGTAEIPVTGNLRLAQAMQARALWESQRANPNDDTIGGEQQVRVYPMSATIRRLVLSTGDPRPVVG